MHTNHRLAIPAIALTVALAVAACGGSASSAAPGTTNAGPITEPTTAPTTAPDSTAPDAGATAPAAAIPTFDLGDLVNNLEGVDSYRVTIAADGETQYSGLVVTKPVLSRDITLNDGTRLVVIGDETWMGNGDDLQPAPAQIASSMLAAFDPTIFVAAFAQPGAMFGAADQGTEEKNGVQAHRYHVDESTLGGALGSLPSGASVDFWIADAGYLVSMVATGIEGGDFAIDLTDVNDPGNVVERPS
jgi:hypothetical protein